MAVRMGFGEASNEQDELPRVGLLVDSLIVPAWAAQLISDLKTSGLARIECAVAEPPQNAKRGKMSWLYSRYRRWDEARVQPADDPLKPVDIASELQGIPRQACDLDVLLSLAQNGEPAWPGKPPRHGIWRIHFGDPRRYSGEAPYFWELYERNPVSGTAVVASPTPEDKREVLHTAFSSTEQGWSVRQNGVVPYWRASVCVLCCLRRLRRHGTVEPARAIPTINPKKLPGNTHMVNFLARNAARTIARRAHRTNNDPHWFIAYRSDPKRFAAHTDRFDPQGFTVIPAPQGHFYADPFVLRWEGRTYIFVEDYPYETRRGCISVMQLNESGRIEPATPALQRPYHLSYPFVFEHDGSIYMIPETIAANRVELYRAAEMPARWEFAAVLKDGIRAVDTTLWVENGIFYFFTNIAERGTTANEDLYLFYADNLTGEWREHPDNPICGDVRLSRSAGKIFRSRGRLIRPAQDCSVRYGYACQLNEIETLSPDSYRERALWRIEPNWHPHLLGTHTINSDETIEVIDGQVARALPHMIA